MACPQILTADNFVTRVVTHIDCQSRYLGSFGFEALAQPGSLAATLVSGLLTLFVAVWGYRMLFGTPPQGRDVVGDVLKVGVVLTLAFSWPAFRTLVYDVVLDGPAQIAASLGNPGIASTGGGMVERLQWVDNTILAIMDTGTGRMTNQYLEGQAGLAGFAGSGLQDDAAIGYARLVYLASLLGSLGLLRLLAGLLLALAPLAAGTLLFDATRGLFAGWLRGLVLTLVGSVAVAVILAVELAVLEPFLRDVLYVRSAGYAAPSAPIEMLALTLGFAVVQMGAVWLLAKVAFMRGWHERLRLPEWPVPDGWRGTLAGAPAAGLVQPPSRADQIAQHIRTRMDYEERRRGDFGGGSGGGSGGPPAGSRIARGLDSSRGETAPVAAMPPTERLGSSHRRNRHARSLANRRKDQ